MMKKSEIYTLDNGLKLIFYQDTSKHSVVADLIVKYGGIHNIFIFDGKEYKVEDGIAHFLEHLLIEHSIYGNALINFRENYINTNGVTSIDKTRFYIHTVHDFEENLEKLIKMVNIPYFNKEDVETTKYAIIEEIRKSNDSKFRKLGIVEKKCLFKNISYLSNLGTEEIIKNLDYETIKLCYDFFYQTDNQILAIAGNIDIEKTKQLIEKIYQEIHKEKKLYTLPNFNEPNEIVKKSDFIIEDVIEEYTRIIFKINVSKLTNYEKVKETFYLNYFLEYNFGESSEAYKYLIENKLSTNNISFNYYFVDKFLILEIGSSTNKVEKFKNLIINRINHKIFDEEDFNLRKNKSIISLIMREENPLTMIGPFIDNVVDFNYEEIDKIEDIENFTLEDFKNTINKLDFSNYCITRIVKK